MLESYLYNKLSTNRTASQKAIAAYYTLCQFVKLPLKAERLARYIAYDTALIREITKEMKRTIIYNSKNKLNMVVKKYQDNYAVYDAVRQDGVRVWRKN